VKANIHPKYIECSVRCACGNTFTSHSIKPELRVELCSNCHPFFTGTQRIVDSAGQVDRFMRRLRQKTVATEARA
jgi:large subunit ribosomal protein L31